MVVERRLRFLKDWDWKPQRNVTIAFKAGEVHFVTAACSQAALYLGVAEPVTVKGPPAGIRAKIKRKSKANG